MSIYDEVFNEYFDYSDDYTLTTVCAVKESEKKSVVSDLCDKLYDKIMANKFDKIDFGNIDKSRGDITSYDEYENMMECLSIVSGLVNQYKGDSESVNTIYTAIQNIEENKDRFKKGFMLNIELPMSMYSLLVLSTVSATSLLISSCVEFIKSPNGSTYDMELDKLGLKRSSDNLLLRNLDRFNKSCTKGSFQKALDFTLGGYEIENGIQNELVGIAIIGSISGAALVAIAMQIIPTIRELIYFFFHARVKISDYLDVQANLLDANAYRVEMDNTMDIKIRESIASKQHSIASKFSKLSDFIRIQSKTADNKATSQAKNDSKKFKADDIIKTQPSSMSEEEPTRSALF